MGRTGEAYPKLNKLPLGWLYPRRPAPGDPGRLPRVREFLWCSWMLAWATARAIGQG
jgi:hypothetical protein